MKKSLLLLVFCIAGLFVQAQLQCKNQLKATVNTPSGMRMRQEPNLQAGMVASVPYKKEVTLCSKTFGRMTYEDTEGFWRKVQYKDDVGYMYDGFLDIQRPPESSADSMQAGQDSLPAKAKPKAPPRKKILAASEATKLEFITETYNYCGNVKNIDAGLLWYGIYPDDEDNPTGKYRISPVELEIKVSKEQLSDQLEFDLSTDSEKRSIFLIGLNRKWNTQQVALEDHSELLRIKGRRMFPGQQLKLGVNGALTLTATGSVEKSGDCPEVSNYHLKLKGSMSGSTYQQDLLAEVDSPGKCGLPEIYWYGDLSGDKIPEIIFVSVYDERNIFTLLMSQSSSADKLLEQKAVFTVENCKLTHE